MPLQQWPPLSQPEAEAGRPSCAGEALPSRGKVACRHVLGRSGQSRAPGLGHPTPHGKGTVAARWGVSISRVEGGKVMNVVGWQMPVGKGLHAWKCGCGLGRKWMQDNQPTIGPLILVWIDKKVKIKKSDKKKNRIWGSQRVVSKD